MKKMPAMGGRMARSKKGSKKGRKGGGRVTPPGGGRTTPPPNRSPCPASTNLVTGPRFVPTGAPWRMIVGRSASG